MKKILVIEDEQGTLFSILKILKLNGFDAIGAEDGYSGIRLTKEIMPDLILCNPKIRGINGYGVLGHLRADPITMMIPFIFITAQTTPIEVTQTQQMVADSYLTKPFSDIELLQAINKFLDPGQ